MGGKISKEKPGIIGWIDYRLPVFSFLKHFSEYQAPKNLNYAWNFGSLAGLALVIQIVTGILLAMQYTPHVDLAFDSVERIMRDVNYGWLIRYGHAVGASFFFAVVYLHIFRGLYYGSYKKPRELLWFIGVFIFIMMMATGFMGYVLPWGQMSFWGATVITNLFSAIPFIGDDIVTWLLGGFSVDNPTLNRFFALHYLLPFIISFLVILHLVALHRFGSSNPTGLEIKSSKDSIPFHPFYTVKDFITIGLFMLIFITFVAYAPNYLGHADNYIEADPMVTPPHIVPEWYFLPFYAILRAIPDKLFGVVGMIGAILIWLGLPWLDSCKIRSGRFRPLFKIAYWILIFDFIFLGWLGGKAAEEPFITLSRVGSLYYFAYFFIIMPFLSRYENEYPVNMPKSISEDCPNMR